MKESVTLEILSQEDACIESVHNFCDALLDGDYESALKNYTELAYRTSLVDGKAHERLEFELHRILEAELGALDILGEYARTVKEVDTTYCNTDRMKTVLGEKSLEIKEKYLSSLIMENFIEIYRFFGYEC